MHKFVHPYENLRFSCLAIDSVAGFAATTGDQVARVADAAGAPGAAVAARLQACVNVNDMSKLSSSCPAPAEKRCQSIFS